MPFFRPRAHTKSMGFRLGDWVEQSRSAEPRGEDVNPRNRTVLFTAGRSDRMELTGDEADDVAEQTGVSSSEVRATLRSQDQASGQEPETLRQKSWSGAESR
ncbi:hypothetical protein D4764_11G0003100 [Takifugu flavidus]|uniref:Uncharacterized protein n=1 Tax=Takifugu flavidus TaxID=433684 RepID=A0A5C6PGZ8_9TELE|nr:hypothetical protein D4764_11G0003100 [Takifugu flavidus]